MVGKKFMNSEFDDSGKEQFMQEVFPAELREIHTRRKTLGVDSIKSVANRIRKLENAEDEREEAKRCVQELEKDKLLLKLKIHKIFQEKKIKDSTGYDYKSEDDYRQTENESKTSIKKSFIKHFTTSIRVEKIRENLRIDDIQEALQIFRQCRETVKENQREFVKEASLSIRHGLNGLAFSGGGIRSATFNLGVLQALAKNGILKHIDYLSTVSGGGYIGSCLSSLLNDSTRGTDWEHFPFRHTPGEEEPLAIKQLRNGSNYLAPSGFFDKIRIPALLFRGIIINFLVFLPYLILAVWATDKVYGRTLQTMQSFNWTKFYVVTPYMCAIFLLSIFLYPLFQRLLRSFRISLNWRQRDFYERSFGILLFIVIGVVFVESLPAILLFLKENWWANGGGELVTWLTAIFSFISTLYSYKASVNISKWTGKIVLWGIGILGPIIILLIYLRLCYWKIFPGLSEFGLFNNWNYIYISAFILWIYMFLFVDANSTSMHAFYRDRLSKTYLFKVKSEIFKITNDSLIKLKSERVPNDVCDKLAKLTDEKFIGEEEFLKKISETIGVEERKQYEKLILKKALLKNKQIEQNDQLKLSKLNTENTKAPYHLINVTLNLQGVEDPSLRGRDSDFFIFSKWFFGNTRYGFCKTADVEHIDHHLDLGTAMAISGAAASPNMGTTTIKSLVFIMTLLNIRLGYWLPNPMRLEKTFGNILNRLGVGPIYLIRELFGLISSNSEFVHVTDGGHIENTAIYELLSRRCKFIIASDAESDEGIKFSGLANLIRYARIDMGIDIDIELDDIHKDENGFSRKHCALGKIDYGKGEEGILLYIKSSVTGDENEYIHNYRVRNPSFPHESTADQFFDESQFEVYRALGYHIVNELFAKRIVSEIEQPKYENIESWFESLGPYLRPRFQMENDFIELQKQLTIIENQFKDPAVYNYTFQVYPEIMFKNSKQIKASTIKDRNFRKIFHLCNQQMQLMENVFIVLQLDKLRNRDHHFNRGWMNLFRRWSQARFFRYAWAVSIGTCSLGFQTFCKEALKLNCGIKWSNGNEDHLTPREKQYLKKEKDANRFRTEVTIERNGIHVTQDQIYITKMGILSTSGKLKESFPVGFATVRLFPEELKNSSKKNSDIGLMFFRIRDYYREMGLLNKMIPKLKETLKNEFGEDSSFMVDFDMRPDEKDRYKYFFERHGFKVKDPDH